MLTETEVDELWNDVVAAEVRSLYFADLGTRYTRHKQIVSGVSFFLASGAAATIAAHLSVWIPMTMATVTAVLTASSIAVNLDGKAATMAKLHFVWKQIEVDRRALWNHWYADDAENRLRQIELRELEASQSAVTDAPYNKALVEKWQTFVFNRLKAATA